MIRRTILSLALAAGVFAFAQPGLARESGERPRQEDKRKRVEPTKKPVKHGGKHKDDGPNHK